MEINDGKMSNSNICNGLMESCVTFVWHRQITILNILMDFSFSPISSNASEFLLVFLFASHIFSLERISSCGCGKEHYHKLKRTNSTCHGFIFFLLHFFNWL